VTRRDGPTVIASTRQDLPILTRTENFDEKSMLSGAYVLDDSKDPTVVILASGSEVHLAQGAKPALEAKGHRVRVVSVPCLEAFLAQPKATQDAILPKGVRRVSIECGSTGVWRGIVGLDGVCIGIDRFGASGPYQKVAEEFGFTTERVTERLLNELG
jgi:transketolase